MTIIGITGVIGSGKSTVSAFLRTLGFTIIDADKVGHKLLRITGPVRQKVYKTFGTADRQELAKIVFSDKKKLLQLDRIMHPAMKADIIKQISILKRRNRDIAIEAAVLSEMGLASLVDSIWLIRSSTNKIISRLKGRYAQTEVRRRLRKASTFAKLKKNCLISISNDGTMAVLKKKILSILKEGI